MVAYGGGRESACTLQVFESLGLADDQEITGITVHPDPTRAEALASLARLRDLFATSVTRAVLADCPVPALVGA
jgi:hypothetical protein